MCIPRFYLGMGLPHRTGRLYVLNSRLRSWCGLQQATDLLKCMMCVGDGSYRLEAETQWGKGWWRLGPLQRHLEHGVLMTTEVGLKHRGWRTEQREERIWARGTERQVHGIEIGKWRRGMIGGWGGANPFSIYCASIMWQALSSWHGESRDKEDLASCLPEAKCMSAL